MNITTVFYRSGTAPKSDCYEKGSNTCLYFLRNAVGFKSYSLDGHSTLLITTISKIKRVVSAIFAFLLLLPLTCIGLVLLKLSASHKKACAEIKTVPQPILPKPNEPETVIIPQVIKSEPPKIAPIITTPEPTKISPIITTEPPKIAPIIVATPESTKPIVVETPPAKPLEPVAELEIHSLKQLIAKKSLLSAPILNEIYLNPDDFAGNEFTDVLVEICKAFPDPTQIKCRINIAASKKLIPSNLLAKLSVVETRVLYQMTQHNIGFLTKIVRGFAEDASLVTSKDEFLEKLNQLGNVGVLLVDHVVTLLALQYVKSNDAKASLEILKELSQNLDSDHCCEFLKEIDHLKTLDINTDELIYSLVKQQQRNIKNGEKNAAEQFIIFMSALTDQEFIALVNAMDVTQVQNCEFLLKGICEIPNVDMLQKVIDRYGFILMQSQIADPIETFKDSDMASYICLAAIHIAGSPHHPVSTDTIANPVKQAFSVLKCLDEFSFKMGQLATFYPKYMAGIFKGISEAKHEGNIKVLPSLICSVMKPIIETQSQKDIKKAFHEFFTRFSDLDLDEFLSCFTPLLPLIANYDTLESLCEALKVQDKIVLTQTPTKTTRNLDKSFELAARRALTKGYGNYHLGFAINESDVWAMF